MPLSPFTIHMLPVEKRQHICPIPKGAETQDKGQQQVDNSPKGKLKQRKVKVCIPKA
jgi:hypothetical protein